MRAALALLLGLAALAAAASAATGATRPQATAPAKFAKATGRISRLTSNQITVATLTCTRGRTSPSLRGLGVGANVAISCRGGTLTKVTDLRTPKPVGATVGATPAGSGTTAATTAVGTPLPPSCPDLAFQVPSVVTLSTPGLTKVVDPPHAYPVTGNTVAEINSSIARCRPTAAGRYDAVTRHSLNYSYVSTKQPDGLCRLTRVAVGIHVAVAIPGWTPGPGSAPGLAEAWQSYIAATVLHEQGHVDLALQWAQQLLDNLGAIGETGCDTIGTQVAALATKTSVALAQANVDYDTATNHGATQGAVFQ